MHYYSKQTNKTPKQETHENEKTLMKTSCYICPFGRHLTEYLRRHIPFLFPPGRRNCMVLVLIAPCLCFNNMTYSTRLYFINISSALFVPAPSTYFHSFIFATNIVRADMYESLCLKIQKLAVLDQHSRYRL